MPSTLRNPLLLALAIVLLAVLLPCPPARAESSAAATLRALAEEQAAKAANATVEEQAATRSLTGFLNSAGASSEATGKAALALSEIALGQGRVEDSRSLADAVLGIFKNASGQESPLVSKATALLSAAMTIQQAYAASAAATDTTVQFIDADSFDSRLSSTLSNKQPSVDVLFPTTVSMKKIPERLDKWFTAIEKSGGKVDTVAVAEPGRTLFGDLISIAIKLYDLFAARSLYEPASSYNATAYYKAYAGNIVKVTFTLRSANK